jgi:hypothetical protein
MNVRSIFHWKGSKVGEWQPFGNRLERTDDPLRIRRVWRDSSCSILRSRASMRARALLPPSSQAIREPSTHLAVDQMHRPGGLRSRVRPCQTSSAGATGKIIQRRTAVSMEVAPKQLQRVTVSVSSILSLSA